VLFIAVTFPCSGISPAPLQIVDPRPHY
jgi:hypothetical protein